MCGRSLFANPVTYVVTTFIVRFSSQCAYSKKVTSLWGHLLGLAHLLFNCTTKNFLILGSNYTTEVCLVVHESFLSEKGPKCNCVVDFCTASLPIMQAYTNAHCCLLDEKLYLVIDRFTKKRC